MAHLLGDPLGNQTDVSIELLPERRDGADSSFDSRLLRLLGIQPLQQLCVRLICHLNSCPCVAQRF